MAKPHDPMTCERFDAVVLDELYGELAPADSAVIREHAAECERCGALLRGLRATRTVAAVPLEEPPAGLATRVVDAIASQRSVVGRRARTGPTRRGRLPAGAVLALAAGFVLFVGWAGLWLHRGQPPFATTISREPVPMAAVAATPSAVPEPVELAAAEPRSEPSAGPHEPETPQPQRRAVANPARVGSPKAATELALADRTFAAAPPPAAAPAAAAGAGVGEIKAPAARAARSSGPPEATAGAEQAPPPARGSDSSTDLRAARQTRDAEGCAAALPLFDRIAHGAAGTPNGFAAVFDSAICHEAIGDYPGARARLEVLSRVDAYRARARDELDRIAGQGGR
jgi:hypothetical protein